MTRFEPPHVIIADVGTDAALYSEPGNVVLVLRPGQSFSNAVAAAQRCLPDKHPDVIRSVVRTYLPDAPDFELPVATTTRTWPNPESEPPRPWYTRRRAVIAGLAVMALLLVTGGWGLAHLGFGESANDQAAEPPPAAAGDGLAYAGSFSPFQEEAFQQFARRGEMDCEQVDELRARCTDWEGAVLYTEATVGPRSTMFSFSYGQDRVTLRVFPDENAANRWLSETATAELYPSARGVGRFVLWGTDDDKLEGYNQLLREAAAERGERAADSDVDSAGGAAGSSDRDGEPADPQGADDASDSNAESASDEDVESDSPGASDRSDRPAGTNEVGDVTQGAQTVPAELGALMLATIGVDTAQAERAAEIGLAEVLAPVQVVAVKMTLGMPIETPGGPGAELPGADDVDIVGGEDRTKHPEESGIAESSSEKSGNTESSSEEPDTQKPDASEAGEAEPSDTASQDSTSSDGKPTRRPAEATGESADGTSDSSTNEPAPSPEPSATSAPEESPKVPVTKKAPTKEPSPTPRPTGTDSAQDGATHGDAADDGASGNRAAGKAADTDRLDQESNKVDSDDRDDHTREGEDDRAGDADSTESEDVVGRRDD